MKESDASVFLESFKPKTIDTVLRLKGFVRKIYPKSNELIYDNYNALVFAFSLTEKVGHTICSVVIYRTNEAIHLGFYHGDELKDPGSKLQGSGSKYRYFLVSSLKDFPKAYLKKMIQDAYALSMAIAKDPKQLVEGQTIIKSASQKKRQSNKTKVKN